MNDKVFLDSNILVYSYSDTELEKQHIARNIIAENNSFISTQVLQELSNILIKKFKKSFKDVGITINESCKNNILLVNSKDTIIKACNIADKYKFSFYDSLIIASALEGDCKILYSEDLQHKQVIEKSLSIVNPFLK